MPNESDGDVVQPLLSDGPSPYSTDGDKNSEGSGDSSAPFPTRCGYVLSPDGLSYVASSSQTGAIDAFGGLGPFAEAVGVPHLKSGLDGSAAAIKSRRELYGSNALPLPPKPSLWALIMAGLRDPTIIMLLCSAAASLILGLGVERDFDSGWIEGASIMVTVCLVVSVGAATDYVKAREFREQQMALEADKAVRVVRGGGDVTVHPNDLVVGDIVRLAVGDIAPADGVLLVGTELKFDESALTGETDKIDKAVYNSRNGNGDVDPFIISGTNVMQGSGRMMVLAVGSRSVQGKILARIREQEQEGDNSGHDTSKDDDQKGYFDALKSFFSFGGSDDGADLMEKLDVLAMDIGKAGLLVAIAVFLVIIVEWAYGQFILGGPCAAFAADSQSCTASPVCSWSIDEAAGTCLRHFVAAHDLTIILDSFITAVTILVVAVPEGLPLAVTLALAVSIRRMTADANQVKHMDSCETMGSATTICSDKTGTLTENRMTTMRAMVAGSKYQHTVEKGQDDDTNSLGQVIRTSSPPESSDAIVRLLTESLLLNCDPSSSVTFNSDGTTTYKGNPTECAFFKLASQLNANTDFNADFVRDPYREPSSMLDWGVHRIPFSSERKRMSWIVRMGGKQGLPCEGEFRMYSKGAPKQMFDSCTRYASRVTESGFVVTTEMDGEYKKALEEEVANFQRVGLRTLALAFRDFDSEPKEGWDACDGSDLGGGMTLLAVFGIEDPLRASVPGAIANCHKAGIDVRMCTGDALTTAVAIAKGCGILRPSDMLPDGTAPKPGFAMTGAEFDDRVHRKDPSKPKIVRRVFDPNINDAVDKLAQPFLLDDSGNKVLDQAAFDELWPTLRVLARCQPEDKLALVRGMRCSRVFLDEVRCAQLYQEHGVSIFPDFQVVAVTGDGTNDAPALKSANVGFAMGIAGTETAKQACDIILLDDNFSSIVKAVMWGRNVFDSISKFIQFQLTVNVVAISLAVVGAFSYSQSPLSAVQMLWVNMIMDSLASLALATELPTEELLDRRPYGRRRPVISETMTANIFGHSVYQIGILCWVLFAPQTLPFRLNVPLEASQGSLHWSLFFNVFVMLQLFNEFNSRKLQNGKKLRTSLSEWNVFSGILSNSMFVGVMVLTFTLQIIIVQYGGVAVNVIPGGLDRSQWAFSVAVGVGGLVWQIVINFITLILLPQAYEEKVVEEHITKPHKLAPEQLGETVDVATATSKWNKVRMGFKRGTVYSRVLGTSFKVGFESNDLLHKGGGTKRMSLRHEELQRAVSRKHSIRGRKLGGSIKLD